MAFRLFPSGQVPDAATLQAYLMNQVVITCLSTARPTAPVDGMVIFETDTGIVRIYRTSGAVWTYLIKLAVFAETGDITVPGLVVTGNLGTINGNHIVRLVAGKMWTGVDTTTTVTTSTDTVVGSANLQTVPVVGSRIYRVRWKIQFAGASGATIGDRVLYRAWNGTVGGTQLGGDERRKLGPGSVTQFEHESLEFIWKQSGSTTIANLNLSAALVTGSAGMSTLVSSPGFQATVEDLGLNDRWTGL